MADVMQGIRSLPLHDLIGATLVAIIEADAQAAQATLEFIETVGFVAPAKPEEGAGEGIAAGALRMADFRYRKLDENNEVTDFVASVPVLSLVPIPALQVQDARFKLTAQITDIAAQETAKPQVNAPGALAARPATSIISKIQPRQYKLLAKPVASSGTKDQETRGNFHLEVEITMGQADLPLGMEKLFNMMDTAIREDRTDKEE
ncbi:MAG: DUF2589 domain-containing protein [Anaerolineae bacterium]|nr:DUF2589 domain-containing protein [Anaerolineae bacterium]